MRSKISSEVGSISSPSILPSATKITRSAYDAAFGSCVTITIVWPNSRTARLHEVEDLRARDRIEVARWLVGKDDVRSRGEGTGDGHTLLLATRQLARAVVEPITETDRGDHVVDPLDVASLAAEHHREPDVLIGGERRDQVVRLEDEADLRASEFGELLVVQ